MTVYAEGRVEHQKRTQTATTLWPFGFVFGVQLGSLENKKTRRGPIRAALVQMTILLLSSVERMARDRIHHFFSQNTYPLAHTKI